MPHLGDGTDIKTVTARTSAIAGGNTDEVQIDADEDRRIVGYRLSFESLRVASDYEADLEVFVGTRPAVGNSEIADRGGQFFDDIELMVDSTNGHVYAPGADQDMWLDTDHSFDWNEDVTLTVRLSNKGASTDDLIGQAKVYYVEA